MNFQTACEILGISVNADEKETTKAFRKKAAEYHPDRNKSEDAEEKFKTINSAYEVLKRYF
jgi:molecular chaperone DnaJ